MTARHKDRANIRIANSDVRRFIEAFPNRPMNQFFLSLMNEFMFFAEGRDGSYEEIMSQFHEQVNG
jgi:hypothetical protein